MCSRIPPARFTAAKYGLPIRITLTNGEVGIPSMEGCKLDFQGKAIVLSWSVLPMTAADWTAYKNYEQKTNGRYAKITNVGVGRGGISWLKSVVVFFTGNRIVKASVAGASNEFDAVPVAKLAAQYFHAPKTSNPVQRNAACTPADARAKSILGAEPTIVLQSIDPDEKLPYCGWATKTNSVSISGYHVADADRIFAENKSLAPSTAVPGLGTKAYVSSSPDGTLVQFVTKKKALVTVSSPPLTHTDKSAMIAVAKAMAAKY